MRRALSAFAFGAIVGAAGIHLLANTKAQPAHESVLCKRGQGAGGEYVHLRRETAGLDFAACEDVLSAYRVHFPAAAADLYCSKTPTCPDHVY